MATILINGKEVESGAVSDTLSYASFVDDVSIRYAGDEVKLTGHQRPSGVGIREEFDYEISVKGIGVTQRGTLHGRTEMVRFAFHYKLVLEGRIY